jgi:hypothetical protein
MDAVLRDWAAAMPAEADATVDVDGDVVDLVTCDPGPDAELVEGGGRSRETISLLATRSFLMTEVLSGGGNREQARCFSSGLIGRLDYELLITDEPTPEQQATIRQVASGEIARCR